MLPDWEHRKGGVTFLVHSLHSQDYTSANFLFYLTSHKIIYIKHNILLSNIILHFRGIEMAEGVLWAWPEKQDCLGRQQQRR